MKRIITFTTDFGGKDHYAGVMKGAALGINPDAVITDITHEIAKFNVTEAAFRLDSVYPYFPEGTIHVVVVDPGVGGSRKALAVESGGHFFVGPDNGVFSLVFGRYEDCTVVEITNHEYMLEDVSSTFHGRDIFAPAAAHLSLGVNIQELGNPVLSPALIDIPRPRVSGDEITGEVIYEDSFGNLITNISSEMVKSGSNIYIEQFRIDGVSNSYGEVGKGELLAIIGSSGLLEISVNQGSASKLFKMKRPVVRITLF